MVQLTSLLTASKWGGPGLCMIMNWELVQSVTTVLSCLLSIHILSEFCLWSVLSVLSQVDKLPRARHVNVSCYYQTKSSLPLFFPYPLFIIRPVSKTKGSAQTCLLDARIELILILILDTIKFEKPQNWLEKKWNYAFPSTATRRRIVWAQKIVWTNNDFTVFYPGAEKNEIGGCAVKIIFCDNLPCCSVLL